MPPINRTSFNTIAQIESNNDYRKIGSHGERSQFQFKQRTWNDYSSAPLHSASSKNGQAEVRRVASLHYDRIVKFLQSRNYPLTITNLATCWNVGMGNFARGQVNRDYSERTLNYYLFYYPKKYAFNLP